MTDKTSAFAQMNASRAKALEALEQKLTQGDPTARTEDTSYWKPTRDASGNGSAVIRFLGPSQGETSPFVKIFSHAFQGPTGQWYIEKSLTTLGQQDYISDHNRMLWATGIDANRKLVSIRKRKLQYVSNIYVIKDPANPENEGKVFKFKYGTKIFDMIKAAWKPEFDDVDPIKPFDMVEGANFRLRIKTVDKYPNYDASSFDKPSPLFDSEEMMGEVWLNQYKLDEELAPENFKSADKLKERFLMVIGEAQAIPAEAEDLFAAAEVTPAPAVTKTAKKAAPVASAASEDGDEEDWFKSLDLDN